MRAVVDTNTLIRAVIKPDGTVGPVLRRLVQGDYELLPCLQAESVMNGPNQMTPKPG
jgi:predicted nucleic acid-binding protein